MIGFSWPVEIIERYGPGKLATRTGGILTAYGLLTIGSALMITRTGGSTILWGS